MSDDDTVSKELFKTEINHIKESQKETKEDINKIVVSNEKIATSLTRLESNSDLVNTRFQFMEDSIDDIREDVKEYKNKHKTTTSTIYSLKSEIEAIKKYPSYTKWALGVIISITVISNFFFGGK